MQCNNFITSNLCVNEKSEYLSAALLVVLYFVVLMQLLITSVSQCG